MSRQRFIGTIRVDRLMQALSDPAYKKEAHNGTLYVHVTMFEVAPNKYGNTHAITAFKEDWEAPNLYIGNMQQKNTNIENADTHDTSTGRKSVDDITEEDLPF